MQRQSLPNKLYAVESGRWAISFLLTALLFVAVTLVCPRVFFINDDENIMYTISGYYTFGVPYDHSFINFCLSAALRGLYGLIPSVQWYGVFHMCVLFLSVTIIFKTVLRECFNKDLPLYIALICNLTLFALLYLFPTTLMQFTTTSAMAGAAACVLLLGVHWNVDGKVQVVLDLILSVLLLLICYMHRKNTGYVAICFYGGTWLFQLVKVLTTKDVDRQIKKRRLRAVLGTLAAAVVLLAAVIGIDKVARNTDQWRSFYEYDNARFKVTDYPHDSYDDNPELYESIGWSRELYKLTGESWWFFMDPRITPETFRAISDTGYYAEKENTSQSLLAPAVTLYQSTYVAQIAFLAVAACAVAIFLLLLCSTRRKKDVWEFLFSVCILLGSVALTLYLCYRQRLPLRAFHTICLPCVSILGVMCIHLTDFSRLRTTRLRSCACALAAVLLLVASVVGGGMNLRIAIAQANERVEKSSRTLAIEQYAMEHPENFYVYDTSLTFRYLPFTVYTDHYPSNLMFWGGMGWKSPAYYEQVRRNGYEELYSDVLFGENVYYITWDDYTPGNKPMRFRLLNYMIVTYPHVTVEQVDSLGNNINVYKIGQ